VLGGCLHRLLGRLGGLVFTSSCLHPRSSERPLTGLIVRGPAFAVLNSQKRSTTLLGMLLRMQM
jgi:hypothetical protein